MLWLGSLFTTWVSGWLSLSWYWGRIVELVTQTERPKKLWDCAALLDAIQEMSSSIRLLNQTMSNCYFCMVSAENKNFYCLLGQRPPLGFSSDVQSWLVLSKVVTHINSECRLKIMNLVNSYPNATVAYENGQSRFELDMPADVFFFS